MKKFLFILLITSCWFSFGYSQYYHVDVFPNLNGANLLESLVESYKPTTVLSYNDARDVMYSDIDNVDDYVSGIYTDHTLYLDPDEAPRAFLFMNGADDGINCEHSYPRSKGADNGNAKSDMHHLYPSRIRVNSSRGSKPFAEIPDIDTDNWFIQNQSQSNIPTNGIDNYSEDDVLAFEPRESVKGNIARSIMYFYTMYKNEADNADPQFFNDQIETLCQWHYNDPVDEAESIRTYKIASHQSNRPNPFVLDCSLAARSYCDAISDLCSKTVSVIDPEANLGVRIYPNPSDNKLNIDLDRRTKELKIEIFNTSGHKLISQAFKDVKNISIKHNLMSSFYICNIITDAGMITRSIIVNR